MRIVSPEVICSLKAKPWTLKPGKLPELPIQTPKVKAGLLSVVLKRKLGPVIAGKLTDTMLAKAKYGLYEERPVGCRTKPLPRKNRKANELQHI